MVRIRQASEPARVHRVSPDLDATMRYLKFWIGVGALRAE